MNKPDAEYRLRIATRESQLALWQANYVADRIRESTPHCQVDLVPMTTLGDRDRVGALSQFGGQGVFTREVQRAVLDGHADVAVHSLKDLPTETVSGLTLACVPPRAERFDVLALPTGKSGTIRELPKAARVGTGSPRRRSQLRRVRPDLELLEIRGNVETRLQKLDNGEFDAIVLAEAGLRRLGLDDRITEILAPPIMFPAVGQAALGIECRADDAIAQSILERLNDDATRAEVDAERACLRTLQAGCHAPVGTLAAIEKGELSLTAIVLDPQSSEFFLTTLRGALTDPEALGRQAAEKLMEHGAQKFI